eukprot:986200-Pyramimonas_sp.AAC.1
MAPRGFPILQDGLLGGSRQPKVVQHSFRHIPKRPGEDHEAVPSALGAPSGSPPPHPLTTQRKSAMLAFSTFRFRCTS